MPLTDLTPAHVCACQKTGPGFLTPSVVVIVVFNDLRLDVLFGLLILVELLAITAWSCFIIC